MDSAGVALTCSPGLASLDLGHASVRYVVSGLPGNPHAQLGDQDAMDVMRAFLGP